ncbi:hydrogenase expression protein [Photobacterium aquimaris]|uniref:ABC transporter ATP-binding protein n=1 Tax=Photobacterium aquimaris TaxID=512643 RepID=A0A2T3IQU5_9GAMM|nr:ABC transporter ATP-binding protein [Photobacterium aquimaris]OBU14994.1 hydrogenase expression protein [Photobacterium aquimaris]OBU18102.1 hydrogenase expression protein [Photobacterium aquimaris]PSU30727.1 ABC transporter ATP-binding protein [Photobacterium aquimaris]PSW00095.1 ABC transporter ATP-binding protein [Photobacterium aquimaris]
MCADLEITITNGSLRYHSTKNDPQNNAVIKDLNLTIAANKWTCLVGKSGCGKSTLIKFLAGLLNERTQWHGQLNISDNQPLAGRVAYMAQQDLLLPWLTVLDNVCVSSKFGHHDSIPNLKQRAMTLLEQVGLADKHQLLPQQLSGGMRQRVALARTLLQDQPIVLMDEPFSALDAVTRYRLQDLFVRLLKHKTVVLITHDPQEAIRLSDQLYMLQGEPAFATALSLPPTLPPRRFDAESANHQQRIFDLLAHNHD